MRTRRCQAGLLLLLCGLLIGCTRTQPPPAADDAPRASKSASPEALTPDDPLALYEHPVWSPDGRRLAFAEWWVDYDREFRASRSRARLRVVERASRTPRVLWDSGEASDYRRINRIEWSSDGRRLMFSEEKGPFNSDDIRIITRLVALDGNVEREIRSPELVSWDWSPDSAWIAFRAQQGPVGDPKASPGLWMIRPDGRGLRQLLPVDEAAAWIESPAWSPDGSQVAFFYGEQGTPPRRSLRVVDRRADVKTLWQRPASEPQNQVGPVWSPDGSRLFAAMDRTLIAASLARAGTAETREAPGMIPAIAPAVGVLACFAEEDLLLIALAGSAEQRVTRGHAFAGKRRGPRLGAWTYEDEFAAEADIASDRAIAVTADRSLYRFLPPFR